jgi:APA family basic amino acid/polyamine antiporter
MLQSKNNSKCCTDLFTEDTDLNRDLGLLETISIVVGRIIGSGIFRTPGPIMALVLSTSLFGFVWVLGGLATIFGAVCYAELVAMMPKSGGPYVYLKAAYPPVWTFLRGWAMFFVSETASIVAVALVFSEYLSSLLKIFFAVDLDKIIIMFVALVVIWLLTAANMFGVLLSGWIQNAISLIKVAAVGGIIGISFVSQGNWSHFGSPLWPDSFSWETVLAIGAAMRYAFFAFSGWEGATYVAEEVKNPRKNLPLSLFLGIGGVMLLYLGANTAYLYQLSPSSIAISKGVAVDAMQAAIGSTGGILIAIAVMINTFGNINTQILCKARTWQAMAHDGLFFSKLSEIHPKYKTPNRALTAQGLWATVLLIAATFAPILQTDTIVNNITSKKINDTIELRCEVKNLYKKRVSSIIGDFGNVKSIAINKKSSVFVASIKGNKKDEILRKLRNLGKKSAYEVIIDFFSGTSIIFNIMTFAAVFILRRKFPDVKRPYKAWLYPYSLIIILIIYILYFFLTVITAFVPTLIGLLFTSTGLIYYYKIAKKRLVE